MARSYPYGQGAIRLVSGDWLQSHLKDRDLMILDVQPNVHDYIQEHIPGAIYLNEGLIRGYKGNLPAVWNPPEVVEPVFRSAGLDPQRPVVVYTAVGAFKKWGDGLEQTFFAYSLARYGHNNVYVLDGGLDLWKQEKRPLSQDYAETKPSAFKAAVRREFFVDYEEFLKIKDRPEVIVLDARPPAIYEGQGPWRRRGHIPGAINLPWASLMHDTNKSLLKPDDEVAAILKSHNVGPDKTIVCSCGTGREATNEFLLFKYYLGYPNVKEHEGAFTEWVAYPDNPTMEGKSPR